MGQIKEYRRNTFFHHRDTKTQRFEIIKDVFIFDPFPKRILFLTLCLCDSVVKTVFSLDLIHFTQNLKSSLNLFLLND